MILFDSFSLPIRMRISVSDLKRKKQGLSHSSKSMMDTPSSLTCWIALRNSNRDIEAFRPTISQLYRFQS